MLQMRKNYKISHYKRHINRKNICKEKPSTISIDEKTLPNLILG